VRFMGAEYLTREENALDLMHGVDCARELGFAY